MRVLSILFPLVWRGIVCGVGILGCGTVAQAGWFFSEPTCDVPAGLYSVQQLGAGYDSLNVAVSSSGQVWASYRLLAGKNSHDYPAAYETWIDKDSASIQCHGDTIDLSVSDSYHNLTLSLVWNSALSRLDATGSYTGDASWARWGVKKGMKMATLAAVIYSAVYLYKHQADVHDFAGSLRMAQMGEQHLWGQGTFINRMAGLFGANTAGYGYRRFWQALNNYLLYQHFYDFTLPAVGAVAGLFTTPLISNSSTYPLRGLGGAVATGDEDKNCQIPKGIYSGELRDPSQGNLEVTIPVGLGKKAPLPKVLVSSGNSNSTYDIKPSTLTCRGNQLVLEWNSSSPSSKGHVTAFYSDEKGIIGTGVFMTSGLWSYGYPILMPVIELEKSK